MRGNLKTQIMQIVFIVVVCLLAHQSPAAEFAGGTGEPNDPYQIATAEDLIPLGDSPEDYDKHFILTANIDLSEYSFEKVVIPSISGTFDGNGFAISNLTLTGSYRLGLIGTIESGGQVKNLGIVNANITCRYDYSGILAGENEGSITTSYSTGTVGGIQHVGGLVGSNKGKITKSYSSSTVTGAGSVGGLVGDNYYGGKITTSYSTGTVSGDRSVGGLVGCNTGRIASSYSTGSANGNVGVGGLVGDNRVSITTSYSTGKVNGDRRVGGLVGDNSSGSITSCFWDTETSGQATSDGGTELSTTQMQDPNIFMDAGWDFAGKSDGPSDIWTQPVGGGYPILWWQLSQSQLPQLPVFSGGTGESNNPYLILTAGELNSIGYNPRLMGKHFKLTGDIDLMNVNLFTIGNDFFPFTGVFDGNGHTISNFSYTSTNPHYIGLFPYVYGVNAEIKNLGLIDPNINSTIEQKVGSLVGRMEQGTITGCYVRGGNVCGKSYFGDFEYRDFGGGGGIVGGLIGQIKEVTIRDVTIRDCHVIDCNVFGGFIAGGLVGFSDGTIVDCSSSGWISGNNCVGGLLGENEGEVIRCYSTGTVSAIDSYVGGLVGISTGIITHSYATGNTSGDRIVGGLIGRNGFMRDWDVVWEFPGYISNCYSTGRVSGNSLIGGLVGLQQVGPIISSFWDIQTSDVNNIGGGIGLTTAEMMNAEFYSLNGWAGDQNWVLDIGKDYPHLAWEGTAGQIIPEYEIDWFEGSGIPEDPYIIATADQLALIGKASVLWDKNFILTSDLDLTGIDILPIGDRSNEGISFTGSFDGNGHIIRNMTMGTEGFQVYYVGLFGHIGNGGIVCNLGLENFQIIGSDFSYYLGGLAGLNDGTIDHCYTIGSIICGNGSKFLGGFVGSNGQYYTKSEGIITNCFSTANISTEDESWAIGGFIGANDGGGIANCYTTGSIAAGIMVEGIGGFAGWNYDEIIHCYAASNVYTTFPYYVGGLVASGRSENVINSFWDIGVSGQTYSDGGTGATTVQMQTASTFLNAGWDFDDIWMICEGIDYPRLQWQNIQCEE